MNHQTFFKDSYTLFKRNSLKAVLLVILCIGLIGQSGCKKEPVIPIISNKIILDSTRLDSVSYRIAVVSSRISNLSDHFIKYGHCWDQSGSPDYGDNQTGYDAMTSKETFSSTLTGLMPDTSYFVRPFVITPKDTIYGVVIPIRTIKLALPSLITTPVTNISLISAESGGIVSSDGGSEITVRGTCWSLHPTPTLENHAGKTSDGAGLGAFKSIITGLSPNTPYYIKAFATNAVGTVYGNQILFRTSPVLPTLSTSAISGITQTSASGGGHVVDDGGTIVTSRGVCWSKAEYPTLSDNKTIDGAGTGEYTSKIDGLEGNTSYFVRAYAISSVGIAYGIQVSFLTRPGAPVVSTSFISDISQTTASGGGNVYNDGGLPVAARGICWSITSNPNINGNKTNDGNGLGVFTSNLIGLTGNTTYYVRAYATNDSGTSYGDQMNFKTSPVLPAVTTLPILNITQTNANGGGEVKGDGGAAIISRGVCWSTTENPDISNNKTNDGIGAGTYTSGIFGLVANTTYFVRAFATNSLGTSYGLQVSFKTSPLLPTLHTTGISEITTTTAVGGGNITSDGGGSISQRGVCWSTIQNPTISDNKSNDGMGSGHFISTLMGLSANTTYYVRAYGTNASGTGYGAQVSFTTNPLGIPIVTTSSVTEISSNSAKGGGTVISDGGSTVTARGICWSLSNLPTIANRRTIDGSGIGDFMSQMTELNENTTYFVRAYATNSIGTSYGEQVEFKSGSTSLSVSTNEITKITTNSAFTGGIVNGDGGSPVLSRGVCWSRNQNPNIENFKTLDGFGIGSFTSSLTLLEVNVIYYVRSYAINAIDTVYGNEIVFSTEAVLGEFTDSRDNHVYKTVWIGTQKWMAENLTFLPSVSPPSSSSSTSPHFYVYNFNGNSIIDAKGTSNYSVYGVLYNYHAAVIGCPDGWHLPQFLETHVLNDFLGSQAGYKMKSTGDWSNNGNGDNISGYNAKPGGMCYNSFEGIGGYAHYWSTPLVYWTLSSENDLLNRHSDNVIGGWGFSVRCLKNEK